MATQGTDNLTIEGIPSVTKLWNNRFRLEFFCKIKDKNEGWYGDNISGWLPNFGTLQQTGFSSDPSWELTKDKDWIYDDMRLVACKGLIGELNHIVRDGRDELNLTRDKAHVWVNPILVLREFP